MARERFAAPGRDLSTDFRRLRLTNFLAFWGQQSRSVNVGEGTCTRMIQSRHTGVICSAGGLSEPRAFIADLGNAPCQNCDLLKTDSAKRFAH